MIGPEDHQPRLVVLTGDGPEHRYVVNRLCAALPVEAIVADVGVRRPSLRRAFRGGTLGGISRVGLFAFRAAVRDGSARTTALRRVLGTESTARFDAQHLLTRVDGVNSTEAIRAVAQARPDALLVFGTSVVHSEMLALPGDLAFNLHTGISPRYRGTDCAFWPVVNREPEWIGATVHECTANVDGGPIFGTAHAPWQMHDGIHELFARAVARGADLYVEVLERYLRDHKVMGERQDLSEGCEYRGSMRTLAVEFRARWALRRGLLERTVAH
jgi:methionyl-tRNA formyltransferase